jgi:maltose alpha-D-glucosyltransferase / alpha-amylase
VFFSNRLFLKGYRRMRVGRNPELELGRFLTEASPFPQIAPVLGAVEYEEPGAEPVTLAILQKYVENQGDLWTLICHHLTRMLVQPQTEAPSAPTAEAVATDFHLNRMALLGRRIGELHAALARTTGDAMFDPEPVTQADLDAWKQRVEAEVATCCSRWRRRCRGCPSARSRAWPSCRGGARNCRRRSAARAPPCKAW